MRSKLEMVKMTSNAFLLEMCMGCLKSKCELSERKTNADVDYIYIVNVCFPELQVIYHFMYFSLKMLLSYTVTDIQL